MMRVVSFLPVGVWLLACGSSAAPSQSGSAGNIGMSPSGSAGTSALGGGGSSNIAGMATGGAAAGSAQGGAGGAGGVTEPKPDPFKSDNLLLNGDAEQGTTAWLPVAASKGVQVLAYGATGYPQLTDRGPSDRKTSFFYGANEPAVESHQVIDLAAWHTQIVQGARFTLSAYLGGYQNQDDVASVVVSLLGPSGDVLSMTTLGGPFAAERLGKTCLLRHSMDAVVPPATASLDVRVVIRRAGGMGNDGYVDSMSLVLHN